MKMVLFSRDKAVMLQNCRGDEGNVMVYNQYENTVLNAIEEIQEGMKKLEQIRKQSRKKRRKQKKLEKKLLQQQANTFWPCASMVKNIWNNFPWQQQPPRNYLDAAALAAANDEKEEGTSSSDCEDGAE